MGAFSRRKHGSSHGTSESSTPPTSLGSPISNSNPNPNSLPQSTLSKPQLRLATRTRKRFAILTSVLLFLSSLFLILLEIGSTHKRSAIRNWYFIRLDLAHIIPASVPNFALINTIAQTIGLHDFYQVGLWSFCEGYKGQGVTYCSHPKTLYWFDPVSILSSELLAGASINLPADINDILDLIKIVSQTMFGFFLASTLLSFVLAFLAPLAVYSRLATLPIATFIFLNAILCTAGTVIATVMFIIFRNVIGSVSEINITADIGVTMFAFMWTATACSLVAALIQIGLCCCCASRRDVRTGRKRGSEKAYIGARNGAGVDNPQGRPNRKRFRIGNRSV